MDCGCCGQDNLLPPVVMEARRQQQAAFLANQAQQNALQMQKVARERILGERQAASRRNTVWILGALGVFVVGPMLLLGSCAVLGMFIQKDEEAAKLRAAKPEINGMKQVVALLDDKGKTGCGRILSQAETHFKEESKMTLTMVGGDHCVHVLGATGAPGGLVSMRVANSPELKKPLPVPAATIDYRLCADTSATFEFYVSSPNNEPFAHASIECGRTLAERGRSELKDPVTSGLEQVKKRLLALRKAGCVSVAEPQVFQGRQSFDITADGTSPCYTLIAASHFKDVVLSATVDTRADTMGLPAPGSEIRFVSCPTTNTKFQVQLESSTKDYYAMGSLDCPRTGPEGLARLVELGGKAEVSTPKQSTTPKQSAAPSGTTPRRKRVVHLSSSR
jgi:hypothetical protein